TEPMPLVSWKMPEMSLSTPTRTMPPEICACAVVATQDSASAVQSPSFFMVPSPQKLLVSGLPFRQPQDQAVEIGPELDLAGQAAVGAAFGGSAVEQRVLVVAH